MGTVLAEGLQPSAAFCYAGCYAKIQANVNLQQNLSLHCGGLHMDSMEGHAAHRRKGFVTLFQMGKWDIEKLKHGSSNGVRCLGATPQKSSLSPEMLQSLWCKRHVLPEVDHAAVMSIPAYRSQLSRYLALISTHLVGCAWSNRCSHSTG